MISSAAYRSCSINYVWFRSSVIMFIVEDVTYNICDQKFHEFEIRRQDPDVFVIRKTLTEVGDTGEIDGDNRLFVDGQEVST